jgi:hypothetical protein
LAGDTASANVNLNKFDGFVKLIGSSAVEANNTTYYGTPATSITAANVVAIVDALYRAIPSQVVAKDDMTIFMSDSVFRTYTIALKNANMFNYAFDGKADSEFTLTWYFYQGCIYCRSEWCKQNLRCSFEQSFLRN